MIKAGLMKLESAGNLLKRNKDTILTKAFEILKDVTLNGKSSRNQVVARCVINLIQNSKWVTLLNYFQLKEEGTFADFGMYTSSSSS
jgi:hypothetical protein